MTDALIGGMMMVGAAASAVSGGAGASGGETVVTGDSSASVQVTNVINADNEGGTSRTIVEKTVNGVKEVVEETKEFAPGEPVIVNTHVEANSAGQNQNETAVEIGSEVATEAATTTTESEPTSKVLQNFGSYLLETITGFFAGMWSWLSS